MAAERWTRTSNTKTLDGDRTRLATAPAAHGGCLAGEASTALGVRDQALFWQTRTVNHLLSSQEGRLEMLEVV